MAEPKTLRVLARGAAMVPNYEALENPYGAVRAFLGRPHDPAAGHEYKDAKTGEAKRAGAFVATPGAVVEVPNRVEYRLHVGRHADLWPADQETAAACGVAFDPAFGGEHDPAEVKKNLATICGTPVVASPEHAPASRAGGDGA